MSLENREVINMLPAHDVAQLVLEEARRLGASEAAVSVSDSQGFSVRARAASAETIEYHQDKLVEITVLLGKCSGSASLSDMRPDAIRQAVAAACHIAQFTSEDPAAGLPSREELAFHYPQLKLAAPWSISVEEGIALACECEAMALKQDPRIFSAEEVSLATGGSHYLYANSLGFIGTFATTLHEMSCVLIAKEASDMQRDYSYTIATDPTLLIPVSVLAEQAAQRTVNRLGAKRLPTMKAPVLFAAEEARGLLGHFVAAISGGNLYRKSSFLLDCLGQIIFPDFVHIDEQPHLPHALGSAPFDSNGVATRANVFVEQGVLQSYALGVYAARKLGMRTTGNAGGVHNLIIQPGERDLPALLQLMDRGLLVTETMGQGVNLITGDYSRGVSGYWIEGGKIQYPVHEVTIAGNLQEIYRRFVAVGKDVDIRGNIRTGSILIEEMMIAGE